MEFIQSVFGGYEADSVSELTTRMLESMQGNPVLQDLRDIPRPKSSDLAQMLKGAGAGTAGMPVDIVSELLRAVGYPVAPESTVGSTDWLGKLMGANPKSLPFIAGSFGSPDPTDFLKFSMLGPLLKKAVDAGQVSIPKGLEWLETTPRYQAEMTSSKLDDWNPRAELSIDPIVGPDWARTPAKSGQDAGVIAYDPAKAEISKSYFGPEEEPNKWFTAHAKQKPGVLNSLGLEPQEGVIYRGMSFEEMEELKKTGKIQSKGDMNFGSQEGLTYFSKNPSQAENYANSFAPAKYKAGYNRPAYVIAVRADGLPIKNIPGVAAEEVGVMGQIDASSILDVYEANPTHMRSGRQSLMIDPYSGPNWKTGGSSGANVDVEWKKIPFGMGQQQ